MTPDDRWLAAVWPFVRSQLPSAPATVLEVGCGPLGGVVPALLDGGYDAVGVDPEAPEGSDYKQVELERYQPPWYGVARREVGSDASARLDPVERVAGAVEPRQGAKIRPVGFDHVPVRQRLVAVEV
jgi:hypothetical protein